MVHINYYFETLASQSYLVRKEENPALSMEYISGISVE